MIIESLISIASFFSAASAPEFFEQKIRLQPGSNIISTADKWNALTVFTLDGTPIPNICYQEETTAPCKDWHAGELTDGHAEDIVELLYFNDTRQQLIVKVDQPIEVGVHFFNSTLAHRSARADLSENSQEYFDDSLSKSFRAAGQTIPRFFSRAEWGADGEGRTANRFERFFKPKRWKVFGEDQKALEPKLRPKLIQTDNADGEQLYWPIYQNPELRKFIVHHTGEAIERRDNTRSNFQIVRAIEKYHSYSRNWGDIGYNYLIDKQGNIYEGRQGGPDSLAAHTFGHNSLSLGVSLMGNFQHENPTDAQLNVLSLLLADHALRFNINPTEKSSFLGKNSDNISGHRDVARHGHGTACPGINLYEKLPQVRTKTAEFMKKIAKHRRIGARDFLGRSSIAPNVQADPTFKIESKPAPAEFGAYSGKILLARGAQDQVQIRVKNNTNENWDTLSEISVKNAPDGMLVSKFRNPRPIRPGQSGVFRGTIKADKTANGTYYLSFWPQFLEKKFFATQLEKSKLQLPVSVIGGNDLFTASTASLMQSNSFKQATIKKAWRPPSLQKKSVQPTTQEPDVKIKIAGFDAEYAEIVADNLVEFYEGQKLITRTSAGNTIKIFGQSDILAPKLRLEINGQTWEANDLELKTDDGSLTIQNYHNPRFGYGKVKYNQFRGNLNIYNTGGKKLMIVNELPLEQYLWGLAEQPKTEPLEKQKAIHILARSYVYVYSQGPRRKFSTYLYDLEDDPRTSQLYLGEEWEKYHQNQKNILTKTTGQIVTLDGQAVIAPYFTQSSGHSSDAWAKQYPWAKVQPLPYDEGLEAKGHGIGLSGNTAHVLADQGMKHKDIIDYFFAGVAVEKKY